MITNELCEKFKKDAIVFLPSPQKGLFLNAAIDNIVHDPSSTRAKLPLHPTSISFNQHAKSEVTDPSHFKLEKDGNHWSDLTIHKSYTESCR